MSAIDLRLGRWQDALADVAEVDALICDPPYSERTHSAYRTMPETGRRSIDYPAMTPVDVEVFVSFWAARVRGWFCVMTDDVLAPVWKATLERAGRYAFAPLACVEPGSRVRVQGDGPANWSVWLVVARPRSAVFVKWGSLVGAYVLPMSLTRRGAREGQGVMGGKPMALMQAIVRDYSRPGDLVCDPCAGGGTTLLAAATEGRRAVGAELDPATHAKALKRIAAGYTPRLFEASALELSAATQAGLFEGVTGEGEPEVMRRRRRPRSP